MARPLNQVEDLLIEHVISLQHMGSYLRIARDCLPDVHSALRRAAEILDLSEVPDLYVRWDDGISSFTTGTGTPLTVISSGC
ncbi:MAG: hypothetical protein KKI08_16260, partial [Armatimonadetes bacterium]|nr:hypothetical protein [Armatimonadota bacterium]